MPRDPSTHDAARRKTLRWTARLLVLVMAILLALPVPPWPWASLILPAASPYVALCSAIAARSLHLAMLLGLAVAAISLFRRRWFCRHVCPVGLIADLLPPLRRRSSETGRTRLPPIGRWAALLTLGGACAGYPLFLWMDPMAAFNGFSGLFHGPPSMATVVSAIGLPAILVVCLAWPGIWRGRMCPLGATQDLIADAGEIVRRRPSPDGPPESPRKGMALSRRFLFAVGVGVAGGAVLRKVGGARPECLRPPGAVGESQFNGLCARCGNCIRVCPARILRPDLGRGGVAALLTPVICFAEDYCREDCRRCAEVCPSGAIRRFPIEKKGATPIGLAKVDEPLCLLSADEECSACISHCPYEAISVVFDEASYKSFVRIQAPKCNGCGACEWACPTSPKAVTVRRADAPR